MANARPVPPDARTAGLPSGIRVPYNAAEELHLQYTTGGRAFMVHREQPGNGRPAGEAPTPEHARLLGGDPAWRQWGPYLSERAWGTVREDYSAEGSAWTYFPHDHARSRAYRWNEDGLAGICDDQGRLCFALA